MAENEEKDVVQSERLKHQLLIGLKTTVEGLLSTNTSNVWGMYGGLQRLCKHVDSILNHRLKIVVGDYGSVVDYWPFVKGLKWLNPVTTPFIENIRRGHYQKGVGKGQVWVRESLREHKLSMQLKVLVASEQHMYRHYFEDAFLFSPRYFKAMCICLQAVEENRVSLLADIEPKLLTFSAARAVPTPVRSASLPLSSLHAPGRGRRGSGRSSSDLSALAPNFVSPSKDSGLCSSGEHAVPYNIGSSTSPNDGGISAKEALRTIIRKSGSESDPVDLSTSDSKENGFSFYNTMNSDPLMNLGLLGSKTSDLESSNDVPKVIKKGGLTRSTSESGVAKKIKDSKAAEMMDRIIHENDDDVFAISKSTETLTSDSIKKQKMFENARDIFSDSETVEAKASPSKVKVDERKVKHTHKRSRSDIIGIKTSVIQSDLHNVEEVKGNHSNNGNTDQPDGRVAGGGGGGGYFSPPVPGQSLLHYLSQQDFHTCANLEKENAHFSISEALIAAIEQMKWNHLIGTGEGSVQLEEPDDSDEEIKQLQQRIRIRKRQKLKEKARGFPILSDGRTDTGTSPSQSASPFSSPHDSEYSDSEASSGEEERRVELTMDESQGNLTSLKNSGLSLSLASLFSDADLQKTRQSSYTLDPSTIPENGNIMSAESVAISLLKKFSEHQLPKASDLQWLVSESDAPQRLLPLPNSYPVSPDDADNPKQSMTRLRGNMEWAPPRPQIIFNIHPPPRRNSVLVKQNYRCTGCGMKVEPGYAKRYRYCEYLGKYFCQCCHSNQLSVIPAKVLHKWDFTKYYVSNFAYDFLAKMGEEPLFNLSDINPMLYKKTKFLVQIKGWRTQLASLQSLLGLCKLAKSLSGKIIKLPSHWLEDVHVYSLNDLISVKAGVSGHVYSNMKNLASECINHVQHCQFCHGFGFICEVCRNQDDILFPYQLETVCICQGCKSCFHKSCYVPQKCPKCARIEARRQRLQEESSEDLDEPAERTENT
ncbi:run domain Beclin-1-interacting and cysteine-rich domain-containing protein-like [Mya arenaria]|uniref:run domain Beclin-1-interacting and cysteine-rich domain-containing protein-like n=1 Tax=Mya arenaria TaxID=6604 RepID=UPI0022E1F18F|nr:run domain Beclin-1-interacting and cysteine-rich domain-containing protein-like [Mya arenaria]